MLTALVCMHWLWCALQYAWWFMYVDIVCCARLYSIQPKYSGIIIIVVNRFSPYIYKAQGAFLPPGWPRAHAHTRIYTRPRDPSCHAYTNALRHAMTHCVMWLLVKFVTIYHAWLCNVSQCMAWLWKKSQCYRPQIGYLWKMTRRVKTLWNLSQTRLIRV